MVLTHSGKNPLFRSISVVVSIAYKEKWVLAGYLILFSSDSPIVTV